MDLLIGPHGIGNYNLAPDVLKQYKKIGITCAAIAFTYQVWLNKQQAQEIARLAKQYNISLSIHAHYWINLNSKEKEKIQASKKRILQCCEIGHYLANKTPTPIVFHAGFYQDIGKDKTYETIKSQILELQRTIKQNNYNVLLCPETTGKGSQFGDLDELITLHNETGCGICVDFAHLKARSNGKIDYDKILLKLKKADLLKNLPMHFSGIEYTTKGERKHLPTPTKDIKELLSYLTKYKVSGQLINESPDQINDSIKTLIVLKTLNEKKSR